MNSNIVTPQYWLCKNIQIDCKSQGEVGAHMGDLIIPCHYCRVGLFELRMPKFVYI